jgi:hypothetical protein
MMGSPMGPVAGAIALAVGLGGALLAVFKGRWRR